jgi:hypothetical protein
MDWVMHKDLKREFDVFAAGAWDPLLRTGYLMTGDARDAEDLVQETLLKLARRWSRVRSMDRPAAYARRVLINLVLHDVGRRSRQRAELWPRDGRADAADESAAPALRRRQSLRWCLAGPETGACHSRCRIHSHRKAVARRRLIVPSAMHDFFVRFLSVLRSIAGIAGSAS